ncbi:hypothetical protein VRRI112168_20440 [Vreelandella rituensis]
MDGQQFITLHCFQMHQGISEGLAKCHRMARLDIVKLDPAMAHQGIDHVTAQAVVIVEAITTHHRQASAFQPVLILSGLLDVLAVSVAYLTDGGDTQADQITVGVGGIALKIALQGTVLARQAEFVFG